MRADLACATIDSTNFVGTNAQVVAIVWNGISQGISVQRLILHVMNIVLFSFSFEFHLFACRPPLFLPSPPPSPSFSSTVIDNRFNPMVSFLLQASDLRIHSSLHFPSLTPHSRRTHPTPPTTLPRSTTRTTMRTSSASALSSVAFSHPYAKSSSFAAIP